MNDGLTQLEDAVRARLQEEAADVPTPDAMRMRVLAALEKDSSRSARRAWPGLRDRNSRPFLILAGAAAAVAIAVAVVTIPSLLDETVEVITADPTPRVTLDLERAEQAATEADGRWEVLSETERVLSLTFASETDDGPSGILRIATPPAATTPNDVVVSLGSTLFDTALVDDSPGQIGGLETRALRLETEAGTTRLGFRIADDTYVDTAGTDRVFMVHIATSQAGTVVFWVEANPTEIGDFEATAGRLIESLVVE